MELGVLNVNVPYVAKLPPGPLSPAQFIDYCQQIESAGARQDCLCLRFRISGPASLHHRLLPISSVSRRYVMFVLNDGSHLYNMLYAGYIQGIFKQQANPFTIIGVYSGLSAAASDSATDMPMAYRLQV